MRVARRVKTGRVKERRDREGVRVDGQGTHMPLNSNGIGTRTYFDGPSVCCGCCWFQGTVVPWVFFGCNILQF